jgi:signal transduction histidine kinase
VGHQLRRALPNEVFAVWLAPSEGSDADLVYSLAEDGDTSNVEIQYGALARQALLESQVVVQQEGNRVAIAAPMSAGEASTGAMLLVSEKLDSRQDREEAQRVVATLAAQTAAAIERVRLVRRVAHKHRLEAVGEVATGVAHELRNPLFGISSAAQLLRFRARDDVVVERNVGRILREVERLSRMVTSLLEFGRPKPIALVSGDPDAVWDDLLDAQRALLEARALVVRRVKPKHPTRLRIDPEQLAQVFLNLLVNAADHAPPASELVMESAQLAGGGWRFRIVNAGPAIPPDVLPRVFEMFYSTKPGGTGIGLALCQRIVEEHGGTIGIESSPEAGTAVTITLPPDITPN